MTKRNYLRLLRAQPTDWLEQSAANPSVGMRPIHLALHKIELRRRQRITNYYTNVALSEGWA